MWETILVALALMMVFEGVLPFISPSAMRKAILQILQMSDNTLRLIGAISMFSGLALILMIK